jgi:hypothetical protein
MQYSFVSVSSLFLCEPFGRTVKGFTKNTKEDTKDLWE